MCLTVFKYHYHDNASSVRRNGIQIRLLEKPYNLYDIIYMSIAYLNSLSHPRSKHLSDDWTSFILDGLKIVLPR